MKNTIYQFLISILLFGSVLFVGGGCSVNEETIQQDNALADTEDNETKDLQPNIEDIIEHSNATPSVKDLLKEYPHLFSEFEKMPSMYQQSLVVPSLSDIPFDFEEVKIEIMDDGANVFLNSEDKTIRTGVWSRDSISTMGEEVELNKGVIGYLYDDDSLAIHWREPVENSPFLYGVGLTTRELNPLVIKENEFTREDAFTVTNSLIDNYFDND